MLGHDAVSWKLPAGEHRQSQAYFLSVNDGAGASQCRNFCMGSLIWTLVAKV